MLLHISRGVRLAIGSNAGGLTTLTASRRMVSISSSLRKQNNQQSEQQLKIFRDNASKWWTGKEFSILRSMNEIRVPFIVNGLGKPIQEAKLMDVGCGGGILAEPLARLGANVLGIDPVFESINQAQLHSQTDEALENRLKYRNCNIEDLSCQSEHVESYDAIIASEVLEHIEDVESFLIHCTKVLKPNGSLFITTINQTPLSWLGVIFFGEYVLKQLPKGTHTYDMFVSVKALRIMLERLGYHIKLVNGFMYEPFSGSFHWTSTTLTHYAIHAVKKNVNGNISTASNKTHGAKGLNLEQQRHFATKSNVSDKQKYSKIKKPKIELDVEDMITVIPINDYINKAERIMEEFKEQVENNLQTRASTGSVEKLGIKLEHLDETIELRDIAQIGMKGNNLIVINLSTMPEAVKPVMKALTDLGNLNPQVEVNTIYVPIPRITREHRENLVSIIKEKATTTKGKLSSLFSEYSSMTNMAQSKRGVSVDLIRNIIANLQYDLNKRKLDVDILVETRSSRLLNKSSS